MRETEPDVGIENISADNLQLIVPNLHRRYSGVTATNRMVAPKLAKMLSARPGSVPMRPTASRGWVLRIS